MKYDETGIAGKYDSARKLPDETLNLWLNKITEHIPVDEIQTIIDIGCGTGRFSIALANRFEAEVIGIDRSFSMLKEAAVSVSHPDIYFIRGNAEHLPTSTNSADLIYLSMVYHHITDKDIATAEFRRVLYAGGFVCIRNSTLDLLDQQAYLKFFPSAMELNRKRLPSQSNVINKMEHNGFSLVKHEIVHQQFANSFKEYYDKIRLRGLSDLTVISNDEFAAGIKQMEANVEKENSPKHVIEPIDLFVFRAHS